MGPAAEADGSLPHLVNIMAFVPAAEANGGPPPRNAATMKGKYCLLKYQIF